MNRKVIQDFIRQADSLDDSQREAYFDNIIEMYEDSVHTAAERVATLESDTLGLLIEYRRIVKAKDSNSENKQKHRIAQSNLWQLLSVLIASTADKGIHLSEDFITKYGKVEFVGDDFGNYVRETYSVREWKEPQHKAPEALQQPSESMGGQLAGNGNETRPDEPQYIELPELLDTTLKARQVFTEAIARGWMHTNESGGYEWNGISERAKYRQLAYMCGKIYGYIPPSEYGNNYQGEQVPWSDLESFFGLDEKIWKNGKYQKRCSLSHEISGVYEANSRIPQWRKVIDKMIKECTSN